MYVKEFDYKGFKLAAFQSNEPINIITFDRGPIIKPDPLKMAGEIIKPGDRVIGLLCKKTSAGFGSFHLKQGSVKYLGKVYLAKHTLIVFEYLKPKVYYGYIHLLPDGLFDDGELFYLNYAGSGRVIQVNEVIFENKNKV